MDLGSLIALLKLAQDAEIAKPTTRYTRVAVAKAKIYDVPEYVAKKIEF